MKRIVFALSFLSAIASFAQTTTSAPAPAAEPAPQIVAVINGENITKDKLDLMYANMTAPQRAQYEKAGGKMAFLDNYVAKRLLLQEAMKEGYDKRPEVKLALEVASESALMDRYVRDVVAANIVTEGQVREYYDAHRSDFAIPESGKIRQIVVGWGSKPREAAMDKIKAAMTEIRAGLPTPTTADAKQILLNRFSAAARKYSEDGVAQQGGDLGWVMRGALDKQFEDAAYSMRPMTMSGIVESQFGYHLIFVEDKKPASTQPYESAKADIREYLMSQRTVDVVGAVKRLTNELRAHSKVALYPENVK